MSTSFFNRCTQYSRSWKVSDRSYLKETPNFAGGQTEKQVLILQHRNCPDIETKVWFTAYKDLLSAEWRVDDRRQEWKQRDHPGRYLGPVRKIMVVYTMVVALERPKKGKRIELYFGGTIVSRIWLETRERWYYCYPIWGRLGNEAGQREVSRFPVWGYVKTAVSMGHARETITKALEFRSEVWLDIKRG